MKYKEQGLRIRSARKAARLTQDALAKSLGVKQATVSDWERGESFPKNVVDVAKELDVSAEYLSLKTDMPDRILSGQFRISETSAIQDWSQYDRPHEEHQIAIPLFTSVELAAGNGATEQHEHSGPVIYLSKSTCRAAGIDPSVAFAVPITGNSMEPNIPDGTSVGIDPTDRDVVDGEEYAIEQDGLYRLKVLYVIPGGYRVHSYNHAEYPDEKCDRAELRVIGRVFWQSHIKPRRR